MDRYDIAIGASPVLPQGDVTLEELRQLDEFMRESMSGLLKSVEDCRSELRRLKEVRKSLCRLRIGLGDETIRYLPFIDDYESAVTRGVRPPEEET